ncbi:tetratricopeptide repeat protein [Streptomyces avermitilis]|uniref:tetratricopeptide repeat protein n=1 Tax=Streptomyces avermitilis TaxID=33903 RepID=UPI00069756F1
MARRKQVDPTMALLETAIKATAKGGIGKLRQRSRGQVPYYEEYPALKRETWRPDIRAAVLANQRVGLHRKLMKTAAAADLYPTSIGTDAIVYPSPGPSPLDILPLTNEGKPVPGTFRLGVSLIRSAVRNADDTTDDRWSERDWQQAAQRAFTALGEQHRNSPGSVGCCWLPACARACAWPATTDWTSAGSSRRPGPASATPCGNPLAPPDTDSTGLDTAADALVELLSALARRQHQHRSRTVARLTTVINSRLLPDDLQHMALYYRAKAHRDLGDSPASRAGMQAVADSQGRLAPAARRGLAHLARMAGDFPTALTTAHTLGWEGRHHRVQGDTWWPHGDMDRAAAAYAAARDEAEHHGVTGERGNSQAHRAFALAFADPIVADDELALAEQLLADVDLRATTLNTHIAALARDAGRTDADIDDRAQVLRAEIRTAGVTYTELALDLTLAFHHAVRNDQDQVATTIAWLRENTRSGAFPYYSEIAAFMAGLPLPQASSTRWIDDEPATRQRWHALVTNRRQHLHTQR